MPAANGISKLNLHTHHALNNKSRIIASPLSRISRTRFNREKIPRHGFCHWQQSMAHFPPTKQQPSPKCVATQLKCRGGALHVFRTARGESYLQTWAWRVCSNWIYRRARKLASAAGHNGRVLFRTVITFVQRLICARLAQQLFQKGDTAAKAFILAQIQTQKRTLQNALWLYVYVYA